MSGFIQILFTGWKLPTISAFSRSTESMRESGKQIVAFLFVTARWASKAFWGSMSTQGKQRTRSREKLHGAVELEFDVWVENECPFVCSS